MTRPPLRSPLGDWSWLEKGLASGGALDPRSDSGSRILYWVRADRDGPVTRHLLAHTTGRHARRALTLLNDLSAANPDWPLIADAAGQALSDPDPQVRRAAATLLVSTAAPERALAALSASTDPVTRIALMESIPWQRQPILEDLRSDPVPAVRLLANVALYREHDPAAWPALDAAIRVDLEASIGALNAPGRHWASALTRLDREADCCAWAEELTQPSESLAVRLEGVRMAVAAMRQWRTAPVRVTPMLTGLLDAISVRPAALHAIATSLTASCLAADDLAAMLGDPVLGPVAATALGATGDHRAVPHLIHLMLAGSDEPRLAEAFRAVARAGADPDAPVAAARQIVAAQPASCEPGLPMRVLAAFGPAAAAAVPELIARLGAVENDTPDLTFSVLGRIGPAAAAAAPALRQYGTGNAELALLEVTGDREVADRYLARCPEELRPGGIAAAMLAWLDERGGLTERQDSQLRSLSGVAGSSPCKS
ncbi:hypothetical protein GCM10010168_22770 [Actinoplanes ianthinogenes]|uniref:HEAT repeat protein n=1 Tax=Actinoplanes ianthinogenes TaxID=122358 RepID=A0ABM7M8H0_9ACTN|nr:hypothetical protein [Actinoplanes ianthinogenes]BCJ47918.1 hypothetical protein Aiant_85750 [Actinoplanes ianthinogenes]GGR05083.1 hypothetical protein GCM10010168_22770 [Actinoplanes ianthinogenes]